MSVPWIEKDDLNWRIGLLVLLLVAFMGPWGFDEINVPAEFECSAPFIRLEGDYCGEPRSGILLFPTVVGRFTSSLVGLITGEFVFADWIREFLLSLLSFIPFLPFFSMLLLILRGDHQRRRVFNIIVWILAIGMGLFWGLNNHPKLFWRVWGVWLYIGLAIGALTLEILAILSNRKDSGRLADVESALP